MFFHITYRVIDPQPWRDLLFGMFRFEEAGGREKRKEKKKGGERKEKKGSLQSSSSTFFVNLSFF